MALRPPWNARAGWTPPPRPTPEEVERRLERTLERQRRHDAAFERQREYARGRAAERAAQATADGAADDVAARAAALAGRAPIVEEVDALLRTTAAARADRKAARWAAQEAQVRQPLADAILQGVQQRFEELHETRRRQGSAPDDDADGPSSVPPTWGLRVPGPSRAQLDAADPAKIALVRAAAEARLLGGGGTGAAGAATASLGGSGGRRTDMLPPPQWAPAAVLATPHGYMSTARFPAGTARTTSRVGAALDHFAPGAVDAEIAASAEFPRGKRVRSTVASLLGSSSLVHA
jgi:hypothetical protein